MPAGRPLKYQSPEELQTLIDAYFDKCDKGEEIEVYDKKDQTVKTIRKSIPYTITGLGLAIGLCRRQIIEYSAKDEFHNAIKRAKEKCENYAELRMMTGDIPPAGAIFALKNYGWTDKQEIENTGDVTLRVIYDKGRKGQDEQE